MQRNCASCGKSYEAQRPQSKYCGDTCRKRAQRNPEAVPAVPVPKAPAKDPVDVQEPALVVSTIATLTAADRLETPMGVHAVELARRLTRPDTAGGTAALSKEWRAVMAEALRNVQAAADPVDELRKRRDAKRSAAG